MGSWQDRKGSSNKEPNDPRDPYDIDYARVIHSGSFRRLQGKTQILNLGDSDFYRTRLTHSLEVSQIATGILRILKPITPAELLPSDTLMQAIALSHDLGHPPFGHGGEIALNYCLRDNGGFEGNGQTLRVLSKLENFSEYDGANLTRRTLLGILKYPVCYNQFPKPESPKDIKNSNINLRNFKPPKCFLETEADLVKWVLEPLNATDEKLFREVSPDGKPKYKSFDCSIMEIADDIAYGVHDLEDAIALGLISEQQFRDFITKEKSEIFIDSILPKESYDEFVKNLFLNGKKRKNRIGKLVHSFIVNVKLEHRSKFTEQIIDYKAYLPDTWKAYLDDLKKIVSSFVIETPNVQHLEFKGQRMVLEVFEVLQSDYKRFLPKDFLSVCKDKSDIEINRIICDYIAGMTDAFLMKTYERLFSPRMGSVFDKL